MSAMIKLKYYTDPGHGWVAVKRKMLIENGVLNRITPFSYQKGDTVYLEEDCDASTLITVLATKGLVIQYVNKHTNNRSPIRNYEHFHI